MAADKIFRGNASQFFIAGELCRRGYCLSNAANTDILCSNVAGTKFVHIQVKTYLPGSKTCSVGGRWKRNIRTIFSGSSVASQVPYRMRSLSST